MLEIKKRAMWQLFKELGIDAISKNHYELADTLTDYTIEDWKEFLLEKDVDDYIKSEVKIVQNAELNKMIQNVAGSRSVGQAQLINTLAKINEEENIKEGPVFIYCYIPLDTHQKEVPNTQILSEDPFLIRDDDEED
jgi:hypothetical protein